MENDANQQLQSLINLLSSPNCKIQIPYLAKFTSAIEELRNLIGMNELKKEIIKQIQFILVNNNNHLEDHMLHTIITGNPGMGKTTVAHILAKIWTYAGIIKQPKNSTNLPNPTEDPKNSDNPLSQVLNFLNSSQKRHLQQHFRNDLRLIRGNYLQVNDYKGKIRKITANRMIPMKVKHDLKGLMLDMEDLSDRLWKTEEQVENSQKMAVRIIDVQELDAKMNAPINQEKPPEPKFVVARRDQLVGKYVGHTAVLTRQMCESALGGVLFIDEAYSLINSDTGRDSFGNECLSTLNEFLSQHPGELICILAGYRNKIEETLFQVQPGLFRRTWLFHIPDYSPKDLVEIFVKQLNRNGWILEAGIDLVPTISKFSHLFQHGGGSTEKLAYQCKLAHAAYWFSQLTQEEYFQPIGSEQPINSIDLNQHIGPNQHVDSEQPINSIGPNQHVDQGIEDPDNLPYDPIFGPDSYQSSQQPPPPKTEVPRIITWSMIESALDTLKAHNDTVPKSEPPMGLYL